MRIIHHILERLSDSKKILRAFATDHSHDLMQCLQDFLKRSLTREDSEHTVDGLIRFLKRLSKFEMSHEAIMLYKIYELILIFVTKPYYIEVI